MLMGMRSAMQRTPSGIAGVDRTQETAGWGSVTWLDVAPALARGVAPEDEITFLKDVLLVYCAETGCLDRTDLIRHLDEFELNGTEHASALSSLRRRLMKKASGLSVVARTSSYCT